MHAKTPAFAAASLEEFFIWVDDCDPEIPVGYARNPTTNPLAYFYQQHYETASEISVLADALYVYEPVTGTEETPFNGLLGNIMLMPAIIANRGLQYWEHCVMEAVNDAPIDTPISREVVLGVITPLVLAAHKAAA